MTTLPYPQKTGVPVEQLLVEMKEEGFYATDKNEEIISDKKGKAIIESITKTTTLYRWNGSALKKVSQKVEKL